MAEEVDYSSLPLQERLVHKVWKVRKESYEESLKLVESSRNEQDSIFQILQPDIFKTVLTDSNVVALEAGFQLFTKYLEINGNPQNVFRLVKNYNIIGVICEKGLSSTRSKTKESSIESVLLMVENLSDPNIITEEIVPYLSNKLPKLVCGCVSCLTIMVENFGCRIIKPTLIVEHLPKLFTHSDKNVRNETMKLSVELYKWQKDQLKNVLFQDLKPIQQKDLMKEFDKVKDEPMTQKRLTKLQQQEKEKEQQHQQDNQEVLNGDDVDMADSYDPLQFVDPVEVLNKLPSDFETRITSVKWKDRKEVLEEILPLFEKAPKLSTTDDYLPLLRIFAKCMKDSNVQVVQLSANCIELIAKGLQTTFQKYQQVVLSPVIERNKEKKPVVAQAMDSLLDTMFTLSSLSSILDETLVGMKLKIPQNKISSTNYLKRCLSTTNVPPKSNEIDSIMEVGIKLLNESQEPIRQAAIEMIGTLMKITGERELTRFLEKIDENRKNKIIAYFDTAQVNSSLKSRPNTTSSTPITTHPPISKNQPSFKPVSSSIPSKRTATSPAKRDEKPRSLASRSLSSKSGPRSISVTSPPPPPSSIASSSSFPESHSLVTERNNQIDSLKQQLSKIQFDNHQFQNQISIITNENELLKKELESIKNQFLSDQRILQNELKHKETIINNISNELDKANYKIKDLEQEKEINKLQQSNRNSANTESVSMVDRSQTRSPLYKYQQIKPNRFSNDINSGVKRLSLGEVQLKENQIKETTTSLIQPTIQTKTIDVETGDDWKRAAEVTSQLKARIERMKQRTRTQLNI